MRLDEAKKLGFKTLVIPAGQKDRAKKIKGIEIIPLHHVSELISGLAIAKSLEATEQALKHVIFPHPTLSEMIHEAVLDADEQALHIFRKS